MSLITVQCCSKSCLVRFFSNVLDPKVRFSVSSWSEKVAPNSPQLICCTPTLTGTAVSLPSVESFFRLASWQLAQPHLFRQPGPSSFHLCRLRSSTLIITSSPLDKGVSCPLCFKLFRSRRETRYPRLHRFHSASLSENKRFPNYFLSIKKKQTPDNLLFGGVIFIVLKN